MQKRISKNYQTRKKRRAERLRTLLQLKTSESVLLDACARKPAQDVKDIIEALPDLNPDAIRDQHLRTPLHIACSRRDDHIVATNIAEILIEAGSDVNNGVGDIDGLQPMHMAVLAGNYQCVLLLLRHGASVPASSPFRLTPLLLAKLKLDNLRQMQHTINGKDKEETDNSKGGEGGMGLSENAKTEYDDLKAITEILVTHLANKHINSFGLPKHDASSSYYGLSDFLFLKEETDELSETISSITEHLAAIEMSDVSDSQSIQESVNGLIAKVKRLGINELNNKNITPS